MKIIHAADLHLGASVTCAPFGHFDPVEAPWLAFERLIDLCIEQRAAALLLAGDQFDQGDPSPHTERRFNGQIKRLTKAGTPTFMVLGNHDAAFFSNRRFDLPEGLHLFGTDAAETVSLPDRGNANGDEILLHGRSYPSGIPGSVGADFALSYPAAVTGKLNLGILHTSLASPDWATISENDLLKRGYDYWALGHEHKPQLFGAPGAQAAYPGNLQGRDIGEAGTRGANILHVEGRQITRIEPRFLGSAQWQLLEVNIDGLSSPDQIEALVTRTIENASQRSAFPQIIRLMLTGPSDAEGYLLRHRWRLVEAWNEASSDAVLIHSLRWTLSDAPAQTSPSASIDWPISTDDIDASGGSKLRSKLDALGLTEVSSDPDPVLALALAQSVLGQTSAS